MMHHRLSPAEFAAVAAGGGGPTVITSLLSARLSRHLFLLRGVLDHVETRAPQPDARVFAANYAALAEIQRTAPAAVRFVLAHPHVGAWIAWCLQRLAGGHEPDGPIGVDLAHLGAIAVAAAIRGGCATTVVVPVRSGRIVLPTLGRLRLGTTGGDGLVRLSFTPGCLALSPHEPRSAELSWESAGPVRWDALRRAVATAEGRTLSIGVDDIDPYRDCGALGAAPRLSAPEWEVWLARLRSAWQILASRHPEDADALTVGVVALVPLTSATNGESRSATFADAAATVALSLPRDATTFAASLIHEMHHTKLNLLNDLTPLLVWTDELFYSPWRQDPRPLWGLLHGTYAFLGVARFWRIEALSDQTAAAWLEFARTAHEVQTGLRILRKSGKLTPAGIRLVQAIGQTLEPWRHHIDSDLQRLVEDLGAEHHAAWRLRNLVVDSDIVATLAAAWLTGRPDPPVELPPSEIANKPHPRFTGSGDATPGVWVGLATTCGRLPGPGHQLIHRRPEAVYAVHRALADQGHEADVPALATWLSGISPCRTP